MKIFVFCLIFSFCFLVWLILQQKSNSDIFKFYLSSGDIRDLGLAIKHFCYQYFSLEPSALFLNTWFHLIFSSTNWFLSTYFEQNHNDTKAQCRQETSPGRLYKIVLWRKTRILPLNGTDVHFHYIENRKLTAR